MTDLIILTIVAIALATALTARLSLLIRYDGYGHRTPPGSHRDPLPPEHLITPAKDPPRAADTGSAGQPWPPVSFSRSACSASSEAREPSACCCAGGSPGA